MSKSIDVSEGLTAAIFMIEEQTMKWKHSKLLTKIINQLPLLVTYRVFTVHKLHYMFRLYSHPQVYHIYKNAKMIRILTDPLSYINNGSIFIYVIHLRMAV
jgi:hypothetical protein